MKQSTAIVLAMFIVLCYALLDDGATILTFCAVSIALWAYGAFAITMGGGDHKLYRWACIFALGQLCTGILGVLFVCSGVIFTLGIEDVFTGLMFQFVAGMVLIVTGTITTISILVYEKIDNYRCCY